VRVPGWTARKSSTAAAESRRYLRRVMEASLPTLAGAISTAIFVSSTLPMLVKAARTKDLSSYSVGNILLSNVGNLVNTIYIVHLPFGPVWALHAFHLITTGLMLFWYLRYTGRTRRHLRRPGNTDRAGVLVRR
jgi:hypothetical protein